jgi:ABC-type amino acid transport substrate-binding protein
MIGEVMEKKADIAATDITVTMTRREAVDFSYGYFFEGFHILTAAPVEISKAFVVLKPFSVHVSS